MKQTAVEWLYEKILLTPLDIREINRCLEQAKAMEKEQRQELYNETEVLQLLIKLHQTESFDNLYDWFNQNKKNNL